MFFMFKKEKESEKVVMSALAIIFGLIFLGIVFLLHFVVSILSFLMGFNLSVMETFVIIVSLCIILKIAMNK